jgi:hypothetical protein
MPPSATAVIRSVYLYSASDCGLQRIAADELFRNRFLKAIIRQPNGGFVFWGNNVAVAKKA